MMATIRRFNTVPQSLEYQDQPGPTRVKSTVDGIIHRLDQTWVSHQAFAGTAASLQDRKDPFSLAGFFPASYLSSPGEHWEWLRQEQTFAFAFVEGVDESLPCTPGPVVFARDEIEETIKREDKMGVLSILNDLWLVRWGIV